MNELFTIWIAICEKAAREHPDQFPLLASWFGVQQPTPQPAPEQQA